jgi:hypothetical protein
MYEKLLVNYFYTFALDLFGYFPRLAAKNTRKEGVIKF